MLARGRRPDRHPMGAEGRPANYGRRIDERGDAIVYYTSTPREKAMFAIISAMYVGDGGIKCYSVCRYKGLGDSSADEWHFEKFL